MSEPLDVSVVIPAFDEAEGLEATLEQALQALREQCRRFEIIVVDDCSRDATGRLADQLAAVHPEIVVLHNERNLGAGASLLLGMARARYPLVVHDAVDYPFDLRDLARLTSRLADADVVVARRVSREAYGPYRKLLSVVNVWLLRALFPLKLRDYNFVQLYRKRVLDAVPVVARSTAFVTPELLIRAHDQGFRIAEVPVAYHPRRTGVATSGRLRVVRRSVADLLRFWWRRRRELRTGAAASERA